jgi:hypothetical protein
MSTKPKLTEAEITAIKKRLAPVIKDVSGPALKAWLKTRSLTSTAATKDDLANRLTKLVADGELKEAEIEAALIGFEESSGKRVYLFHFDPTEGNFSTAALNKRLAALSVPLPATRKLAGDKAKPMTAVYSTLEKDVLRVKWSERQKKVTLNEQTDQPQTSFVDKRIVFIADLAKGLVELRLDPPENRHTYEDASGRTTEAAYYAAYTQRCEEIMGITLEKAELAGVIKALVAEETPRVIRIHIDNHTNQKNFKWNVRASRLDMRDDPEWKAAYKAYGHTWAWDSQSFHWLPAPSGSKLQRELFSHLQAVEGFLKVNADCSDEEVEYAVAQVRAR